MPKIVLIGTSHKYQTSDGRADADSIEQFRQLLIALCSEHKAKAIAEEMSVAVLAERGVSESVACTVAAEMKFEYQLSDPTPELRTQLGIHSENDIRIQGFPKTRSQQQIEAEIRKSYAIREGYWLNQLGSLNSWPLLFVCGANHSKSFSTLLRDSGFEVIVAFADWEPNLSLNRTREKTRPGR